MTKARFPHPKLWLSIRICEITYKAFKEESLKYNLGDPLPDFNSRYSGALESILGSVQLRGYLESNDIAEVATSYFVKLAKAQVFFDANKRMAVMLTNSFLVINKYELDFLPDRLRDLAILLSIDRRTGTEESIRLLTPEFKKIIKKLN